jgi:hypothetical protein
VLTSDAQGIADRDGVAAPGDDVFAVGQAQRQLAVRERVDVLRVMGV